MDKCVLYARVSTKEQEEGYSLDSQQKSIRAYCATRGLSIVEAFVEASSASKPGRGRFAEMVTYMMTRPDVRTIVVQRLDRLSRNWEDKLVLENIGARIRCVEGDSDDTPVGQLFSDMQQSYAVYYSRELSSKVRTGMQEKAAQGGWGHRAPLGYLNNRDTHTIHVDESRRDFICHAFERYSTGLVSLSQLRDELHEQGLRTVGDRKVSTSTLHRMLTNPLYAGLVPHNGEVLPGLHEPIVSRGLFDRVQAALEPNRSGNKQYRHEFLLRDFLICGDCGCKVTAQLTKGHTYYRCTHGKGKTACGQRGTVREEVLVPQVAQILRRITLKPKYVTTLVRRAEELDADLAREGARARTGLQSRLEAVERRASVLADKLLDGTISDGVYRSKDTELSEEANALKLRLAALDGTAVAVTPLVEALANAANGAVVAFGEGSIETRREVLALTLSNLTLRDKEIVSYQWKRPFGVLESDPEGAFEETWWATVDGFVTRVLA
jgi:DNA invertase Pin-like site-specific DNA recombinase